MQLDGLPRWLAWGLAALVTCCAQVNERDQPRSAAGEAGQASSSGSGAGGSANVGGSGGSGLSLGGIDAFDVAGAGPVALPLLDTTLCQNEFVRVDQVAEAALFFSGTFDGEPVDVLESADVTEPPAFFVFRFGSTHVEAISFSLYFAEGPYKGFLQVSAVDCGMYGALQLHPEAGPRYSLASAKLVTVTRSVDGFSGLTTGSVSASWIHDDGEEHVLEADFTLNAIMGDARIRP